ncbi:hypothetical protein PHPALM_30833 [Phytophthora palmivora]|uniref:Uncharacterized protein n=1 Tax=Phytophthora palmivora TaxID=4796 RepID=A0A2P4X443_9STRA|nr:hypothetical protein PHPALM_30833 [Phytophthora palmivora]
MSAIKELVLQYCFGRTGDLDRAFFFGGREDECGHAYVGKGTDDDVFLVGVTGRDLIDTSLEFAAAIRYTLFHTDAIFKLCDLDYPVIICEILDELRSYHLSAIPIVLESVDVPRTFSKLMWRRLLRNREIAGVLLLTAPELQTNGGGTTIFREVT